MSRTYPKAVQEDIVEDMHGVPVADPYRWLESAEDPRTQDWLAAQADLLDQERMGAARHLRDRRRRVARSRSDLTTHPSR